MKNKSLGFTFLEIIIALSILTILAMIVIPNLKERKARAQVDAAVQIGLKDAQFLQKWYTINGRYSLKKGVSGCPVLPYRFYPESDTQSAAEANYKIKVESMFYFDTAENGCQGNQFKVIGRPICGTIVADMGNICIDQNGNVSTGFINCTSTSFNPDKDGCIPRDIIPSDKENEQEKESGGEVKPINPDDNIPDPSFCEANPTDPNCQTVEYCTKYKNLNQEQCKCVLDYRTNPACWKPDEDNCTGISLSFPECACSTKRTSQPDWCQSNIDCSKTPDAPMCKDECKNGKVSSPFCACWNGKYDKDCQNACKTAPIGYKPSWCTEKDYCEGHKFDPICSEKEYCASIGYITKECQCILVPQPNWCKEIDPDDDFCKYEVNFNNQACRKSDEIRDGDILPDKCTNQYECIKQILCNSKDKERYDPGFGTNWTEAWKIKTCASTGKAPNYPKKDNQGYSVGELVTLNNCETYRANEKISNGQKDKAEFQPKRGSEYWTPVYNSCHTPGNDYKDGDYVYDPKTGKSYRCLNAAYCNICNIDGTTDNPDCAKSSWQL